MRRGPRTEHVKGLLPRNNILDSCCWRVLDCFYNQPVHICLVALRYSSFIINLPPEGLGRPGTLLEARSDPKSWKIAHSILVAFRYSNFIINKLASRAPRTTRDPFGGPLGPKILENRPLHFGGPPLFKFHHKLASRGPRTTRDAFGGPLGPKILVTLSKLHPRLKSQEKHLKKKEQKKTMVLQLS